MRLSPITVSLLVLALFAPQPAPAQDAPEIDNFVHSAGVTTAPLGTLGRVETMGNGEIDLVLIPGAAFDWTIWRSFMDRNADRYTMHAITPAGYGGTNPPPMPERNDRFEYREWTEALIGAVTEYVREHDLDRPIVVGHHLMGDYYAMRLALDHPDLFRGVAVVAGTPLWAQPPLAAEARRADEDVRVTTVHEHPQQGPFFRRVSLETWRGGAVQASSLSTDEVRSGELFEQQIAVPLPTQIRYFLEYLTDDVTKRFDELRIPLLSVIQARSAPFLRDGKFDFELLLDSGVPQARSRFEDGLSDAEVKERYRQQIFDAYGDLETIEQVVMSRLNPWAAFAEHALITVESVGDTRIFIMDDQPERLDGLLAGFAAGLARTGG